MNQQYKRADIEGYKNRELEEEKKKKKKILYELNLPT
jgi:hypothetical protein